MYGSFLAQRQYQIQSNNSLSPALTTVTNKEPPRPGGQIVNGKASSCKPPQLDTTKDARFEQPYMI